MRYTIFIILILVIGLVGAVTTTIYKEVTIKQVNELSKKLVCDKLNINKDLCLKPISLNNTGIVMEQVNISNQEMIKVYSR